MKRENGYINLDEYFRNLGIQDESSYVKKGDISGQYWITINGEDYYFKMILRPYTELLVSEIAKFLGIKAATYDLAIFKGFGGVISKSFRKKDCKYIPGDVILEEYLSENNNLAEINAMKPVEKLDTTKKRPVRFKNNSFLGRIFPADINNLEIIWQAIEYRYAKRYINIDIANIMDDLVLYFILNILTGQSDALPHNWELEESKEGVSLAPVFDNERCFTYKWGENYSDSKMSTSLKDAGKGNYEILTEFLKISSTEYINLFIEKYDALTLDVFKSIIKNIEQKLECPIPDYIKDEYLSIFMSTRMNIKLIMDKMNLYGNRSK